MLIDTDVCVQAIICDNAEAEDVPIDSEPESENDVIHIQHM